MSKFRTDKDKDKRETRQGLKVVGAGDEPADAEMEGIDPELGDDEKKALSESTKAFSEANLGSAGRDPQGSWVGAYDRLIERVAKANGLRVHGGDEVPEEPDSPSKDRER